MKNLPEPLSIPWHQLLGALLELALTPVDIQVETEVQVMAEPPKADILLLRRKTPRWTEAQRALLPDGIRESSAGHQLLEFKYSESVSEESLAQAVAYEYFYRTARRLQRKDVQVWLISSKTPHSNRLQDWGYDKTELPGVYQSHSLLVNRVRLLVLNQLSAAPYNAFVKVFASRQDEKEVAFRQFDQVRNLEARTQSFLRGLREMVEVEEDSNMTVVVTPEYLIRRGEELTRAVLEMLTPAERLAGLKPEERVAGLQPEERIVGVEPDELLSLISIEDIEAYLERHRPKPKGEDKVSE